MVTSNLRSCLAPSDVLFSKLNATRKRRLDRIVGRIPRIIRSPIIKQFIAHEVPLLLSSCEFDSNSFEESRSRRRSSTIQRKTMFFLHDAMSSVGERLPAALVEACGSKTSAIAAAASAAIGVAGLVLYASTRRKKRDLKNKKVLITGGAGGLGKALGRAFARRGARVVLWDLQRPQLETVLVELRREFPSVEFSSDVVNCANRKSIYDAAKRVDDVSFRRRGLLAFARTLTHTHASHRCGAWSTMPGSSAATCSGTPQTSASSFR